MLHLLELLVRPQRECAVQSSKNKVIAVQKNGLWGFVDEKGKVKIPPQYKDVGQTDETIEAIDVLSTNGERGMVSSKGKEIIKPEFDMINGFSKKSNTSSPFGGDQ